MKFYRTWDKRSLVWYATTKIFHINSAKSATNVHFLRCLRPRNMDHGTCIAILLFCVVFSPCSGFLPTQESGKPGDFSHQSITERGIYEAAAVFIRHYIQRGANNQKDPTVNAINVTEDFFKGGWMSFL